jgi:glucosamine--fructose-6-phosphate aminotransferase (isomerizing)
MCGIAGIFDVKRKANFERVGLARELLLAIERRGRHATGYAFIKTGDDSTEIVKADIPASEFVQVAPMFTDGLDGAPRAILLHTRYATQGKPSNNWNNHPIYSKHSGMTLIHNGWLTNEEEILEKYGLHKDGEVDSETILRLIEHFMFNERKRIITAIRLAMRELKGVFACALISEKYPDTMWLWRSGNPLNVYRDKKTEAFIFASTRELLSEAVEAAGLRDGKLSEFPEFKVACFKAIKGRLHASFGALRKRPRPVRPGAKKQSPI